MLGEYKIRCVSCDLDIGTEPQFGCYIDTKVSYEENVLFCTRVKEIVCVTEQKYYYVTGTRERIMAPLYRYEEYVFFTSFIVGV